MSVRIPSTSQRPRALEVVEGIALALGVGAAIWLALGLFSATSFTITSAVTSLPACRSTALLYPGVPRCLTYTVTNPNPYPIKVTRLGVDRVISSAPSSCPSANLDLRKTQFSGSLTVPATGATATSVPIDMGNNGNQDRCSGVILTFTYDVTLLYRTP
jgi:hypothetical protein